MVVTARAVGLGGEHRARLHRLAVEQHGARAARRGVAADVGAGEAEHVAQVLHEQRAGLDSCSVVDSPLTVIATATSSVSLGIFAGHCADRR